MPARLKTTYMKLTTEIPFEETFMTWELRFQRFMEKVWAACPADAGTTQTFTEWKEKHSETLRSIYYENKTISTNLP